MAEPKFLDFLDRIDGGGAGQSGDTFEGGGLLSLLGNLLASPYGSENPERMAARQAFYNSDNSGGEPMTLTPQPQVSPQDRPVEPNDADPLRAVRPQARPFELNYADRFAPPPFQRQPVVTHPVYTYNLDDPFEPNYTDRFALPDAFTVLMERLRQQGIPTGNVPR